MRKPPYFAIKKYKAGCKRKVYTVIWQNRMKAFSGGEGALTWKTITTKYNTVVDITIRVIYRSHPKLCSQHLLHFSV